MVDPIAELAPHRRRSGDIGFHVDSCVGGCFLPFVEELGEPVPLLDFRVPGVTTISADLHKFGYTAKGASADHVARPRRVRPPAIPVRRPATRPTTGT